MGVAIPLNSGVARISQWEGVWRQSPQPSEANGDLGAKPRAAGGWCLGAKPPAARGKRVWVRSPFAIFNKNNTFLCVIRPK